MAGHRYLTRSRGKPKVSAFDKVRDEDGDVLLTPRKVRLNSSKEKRKNAGLTVADAFAKSYFDAKGINRETKLDNFTVADIRRMLRDLGYSNTSLNKKNLIEKMKREIEHIFNESSRPHQAETNEHSSGDGEASDSDVETAQNQQDEVVEPIEEVPQRGSKRKAPTEAAEAKPLGKTSKKIGFATPSKRTRKRNSGQSEKIARSWKSKLDINQVPINVLKKASKAEVDGRTVYRWEDRDIETLTLSELQAITSLVKVHHAGKEATLRTKIKGRIAEIIAYVSELVKVPPPEEKSDVDKASAVVAMPASSDQHSVMVDFDAQSLLATQLEVLAESDNNAPKIILEKSGTPLDETTVGKETDSVLSQIDASSSHGPQIENLAEENISLSEFEALAETIDKIQRAGGFRLEETETCERLLLEKKAELRSGSMIVQY